MLPDSGALSSLASASALALAKAEIDANNTILDKLDTALEVDGAAGYQFTTLGLENAPSGGGGGGDATLANQTTIITHLTDVKGAGWTTTDSLEAIRDQGDSAWLTGAGGSPPQLLQTTTIDALTSQTVFTLAAGSSDDNAYNGATVVFEDSATSTQKAVGQVADYDGTTRQITLTADPGVFTFASGDSVKIIAGTFVAGSAGTIPWVG